MEITALAILDQRILNCIKHGKGWMKIHKSKDNTCTVTQVLYGCNKYWEGLLCQELCSQISIVCEHGLFISICMKYIKWPPVCRN